MTITQRIVSLQALRFVAAAMVIAYHAGCAVTTAPGARCSTTLVSNVGAAGVDIFFVLSGFVISLTGPLAVPRPTGVQFFWRRWSRVAPIFYILSLPFIAQSLVKGRFNWPEMAATILFWPAVGPEIVTPFLQAGWTLGFEMLFYATVSVVLLAGRVRRHLVILAFVLVGLALARLFSGGNSLRILANPIFIEFAFGAGLARIWPLLRALPTWIGAALIAAGVVLFALEAFHGVGDALAVLATLRGDNALTRVVIFGVPGALIVAGACICDRVARNAAVAVMAWLGDASYSTYLSQAFTVPTVSRYVLQLVGRQDPGPSAGVIFVIAIAVGAAVYVSIERPILNDLRRVRFARTQAAGVPG